MDNYLLEISNQIQQYKKEIDKKLVEVYPKGPQSLLEPIQYILKGEGKRLITQSAVKINDTTVDDIHIILKPAIEYTIKVGKRRFIKII